MEMKVEIIPRYNTVYIRKVGPYGKGNIETMEKLKEFAETKDMLSDESIILGIAHDNPENTKPENCRYDACLVISDDFCINEKNIKCGDIDGGKYGVFIIEHTAEGVQKAWNEIFSKLLRQGYTIDDSKPIMERYKVKMVKNHKCEICIPII